MVDSVISSNARLLEADFAWFERVLEARLRPYVELQPDPVAIEAELAVLTPPPVEPAGSFYGEFVAHYRLSFAERLTLLLALIPHVRPQLLDPLFSTDTRLGRGFTEFGGVRSQAHGGFLPTGETALLLAGGSDLPRRLEISQIFSRSHFFAQHGILRLHIPAEGEPIWSGQLELARQYVDYFTTGKSEPPPFGPEFPAKLLESTETWTDLVLESTVEAQLRELFAWVEHGGTLMEELGFARRLRPGYRSLFHGPSGTGKTMTAALIGEESGLEVYRVDLSLVVSKYIGETEKNLSRVFEHADHRRWILFFDEADALFGKRTSVRDAHDRFANQEVAYLLQRVEEYPGLVILASNFRDNIDDAFTRRFDSIIHFPMPRPAQRERMWRNAFTDAVDMEKGINFREIARKFDISGGAIMNVARYATLMGLNRGSRTVALADVEKGIHRELLKEGRSP